MHGVNCEGVIDFSTALPEGKWGTAREFPKFGGGSMDKVKINIITNYWMV